MDHTHILVTLHLTKSLNSRCEEEGSCYIVNASSWLGPLDVVQPIYGYLMPVFIFITFFSNSLIIIVLSRFAEFKIYCSLEGKNSLEYDTRVF